MARKLKSEEEQPKGLGDPILLEKIDKLFACNVGEHVNLPQLVVVGDQSSGKSSVLAGLMRLPFPRDSGLCTRFATQIIFRRSAEERIVVSIIPDVDASPEHANHVKAWSVTDLKSLDANSFARIMKDVSSTASRKPTSDPRIRRILRWVYQARKKRTILATRYFQMTFFESRFLERMKNTSASLMYQESSRTQLQA